MDKINFNTVNNTQNVLPANKKDKKLQTNCENYQVAQGIYPVYTQVPYGINQRNYVEIAQAKLPTGEIAHIYKLINGQTVSVVQKAGGCPIIKTAFKVGALDEPDGKEGISHLIEHSIFHESKKYADVNEAINEIGTSNADTCSDGTSYYIKLSDVDKETLEKAIDIEADMLFNPKFTKVDSREKGIVVKEAKEDEADELRLLNNSNIKNLFSIDKPNIKSVMTGSEDSIKSITLDDMFKYHKEYYIPSNCSTSIVSPLNPDEVMEIVSRKFLEAAKDIQNHPIERKQYNLSNSVKRSDLISKTGYQKKVRVGFNVAVNNCCDDIKLDALCRLIKSRSGLALNTIQYPRYGNYNYLCIASSNKSEYDTFESIKECFSDIMLNPPSDDELKEIKNDLALSQKESYVENTGIADTLSRNYLNSRYDFEAQQAVLKNLSARDILEALGKLDVSKSSIQVLHPKDTTQEDLNKDLEDYGNYVSPVIISRNFQKINVENNMENYNIYPYSTSYLKSTVLPNNTRFIAVNNPKDDECCIEWELYNPESGSFNPAAKIMLNKLPGIFSSADEAYRVQNDIFLSGTFDINGKATVKLRCKLKDLQNSMTQFKKTLVSGFDEKDFEAKKQEVIEEIKSYDDNAFIAFITDKCGDSTADSRKKMLKYFEKLTLNDVKKYYNAIFTNSYSTLCAKIPFENNAGLIDMIASEMNMPNYVFRREDKYKFEKMYKPSKVQKCYIEEKNQPQYDLVYSFKRSGNIRDEAKFNILNNILSKRIFDNLREKQQLAYQADSSYSAIGDMGIINPCIVTNHKDKETIAKIYSEFESEIKRIMQEPVSEKELKEAKNGIKRNCYDLAEDSFGFIDEILLNSHDPYGLNQMQNNIDIINSITADDILDAAQYAFKNKPDYLIETDKESIKKNKDYFNSLATEVIS